MGFGQGLPPAAPSSAQGHCGPGARAGGQPARLRAGPGWPVRSGPGRASDRDGSSRFGPVRSGAGASRRRGAPACTMTELLAGARVPRRVTVTVTGTESRPGPSGARVYLAVTPAGQASSCRSMGLPCGGATVGATARAPERFPDCGGPPGERRASAGRRPGRGIAAAFFRLPSSTPTRNAIDSDPPSEVG